MSTKQLSTLMPPTASAFMNAICQWPHLQRVHEKLAIELVGLTDSEYEIGPYFDTWVLEGNEEKGFTGIGVTVAVARAFYKKAAEMRKVPTLVEFLTWIRAQPNNHLDDKEALEAWIKFATTFEFEEDYLDKLAAKIGISRHIVTSKLAAVWNPLEDSHEFAKRLEALIEGNTPATPVPEQPELIPAGVTTQVPATALTDG